MKICLFTDTLGDLNGVSRFIQDMGELAKAHQHSLQIVTSTQKPLPEASYIHNLPHKFRIAMPFYQELDLVWPNAKLIDQILLELNPDLVHISTPGPFGWVAKNRAQKLGFPLVGTYHTDFPAYLYDLTRSHWVKKQTDKTMSKFYQPFAHTFSRSETYRKLMQDTLNISQSSTLPAGTNLQKFHPNQRHEEIWQAYGLDNQRIKILYVGRINIEKNIPFLLKVWQKMMTERPDLNADLILIGEGRYRKLAPKMRAYHVHFLGPIRGSHLPPLYANSDGFVFPSVTDTLGQVIMEAQASGLGCLVSDQGGPQSLVQEGETGRILVGNDPIVWQQALIEMIENQELRIHWGQQAHRAMQNYNIEDSYQAFHMKHLEIHQQIQKSA